MAHVPTSSIGHRYVNLIQAAVGEADPPADFANALGVLGRNDHAGISRFSIRVETSPAGLEAHLAEWERLASSAIDPNAFYEPWYLLPAWRELAPSSPEVLVVLVFEEADRSGSPRLCGLFPLERLPRFRGIPIGAFKMWQRPYCFLCTPLIEPDVAPEVVEEFLLWLGGSEARCAVMEFNQVQADGGFHQALAVALGRWALPVFEVERHRRALFEFRAEAESFLDEILSKKKRKELRRIERRLAELGEVAYDRMGTDADVGRWVEEFLSLEASGWKGRAGSAFASQSELRRFFDSVMRGAHARGRLAMLALRLNGRAIAMKCNFVGARAGFAFKIAYDEAYAKYSPGVFLELNHIREEHTRRSFPWMDSCARPGHPMIDHLWPSSRFIETRVVSTGGWSSNLLVSSLPLLRTAKRRFFPERAGPGPHARRRLPVEQYPTQHVRS